MKSFSRAFAMLKSPTASSSSESPPRSLTRNRSSANPSIRATTADNAAFCAALSPPPQELQIVKSHKRSSILDTFKGHFTKNGREDKNVTKSGKSKEQKRNPSKQRDRSEVVDRKEDRKKTVGYASQFHNALANNVQRSTVDCLQTQQLEMDSLKELQKMNQAKIAMMEKEQLAMKAVSRHY